MDEDKHEGHKGFHCDRILGLDRPVPLLDGRLVPYLNLDNAASTPPLRDVVETVERSISCN